MKARDTKNVGDRLGGFSLCAVAGVRTRRYHGMLIAALPAPIGRAVMLTHVKPRPIR